MDTKTMRVFSEVYALLDALGDEYIHKLPYKLYQMIDNNRDVSYTPVYDTSSLLSGDGISRESLSMIALFHLNYWCETEEEKKDLQDLFERNEEINKQKRKENNSLQSVLEKNKIEENAIPKNEPMQAQTESSMSNQEPMQAQTASQVETTETSLTKQSGFFRRIFQKLFHIGSKS